jgi:hypothetical protein
MDSQQATQVPAHSSRVVSGHTGCSNGQAGLVALPRSLYSCHDRQKSHSSKMAPAQVAIAGTGPIDSFTGVAQAKTQNRSRRWRSCYRKHSPHKCRGPKEHRAHRKHNITKSAGLTSTGVLRSTGLIYSTVIKESTGLRSVGALSSTGLIDSKVITESAQASQM